MNQQEIDRLWFEHQTGQGHIDTGIMTKTGFAQAAAEIRRQAFLEAADIVQHFIVAGNAALQLREIAEQEKS